MSRAKTLKRVCQNKECPVPRHAAKPGNYVYYSKRTKMYAHGACHGPNPHKRKKSVANREWYQTMHASVRPKRQAGTTGAERMPNAFITAVDTLKKRTKEVRRTRTRTQ